MYNNYYAFWKKEANMLISSKNWSKWGFWIAAAGLLLSLWLNYDQNKTIKGIKTTFATVNEKAFIIHKHLEKIKKKDEPINIELINDVKDSIIYEIKIKFFDLFRIKLDEYEKSSF
jgi:hypothetical protein